MRHGESSLPILVEEVVVQRAHLHELVVLVEVGSLQRHTTLLVVCCLDSVVETTVLIRVEHLWSCHLVGKTKGSTVRNSWSTHLSLFCGHKDNTVSSTCTIDSGCSILENGNRLHLRRVKVIERSSTKVLACVSGLHIVRVDISVDYVKRFLRSDTNISERVCITDFDCCVLSRTALAT